MPSEIETTLTEEFGAESEEKPAVEETAAEDKPAGEEAAAGEEGAAEESKGVLGKLRQLWRGKDDGTQPAIPQQPDTSQQIELLTTIAQRLSEEKPGEGEVTRDEIEAVFTDPGLLAQLEKIQKEDPDKLVPAMMEVMAEASKRGLNVVRKETAKEVDAVKAAASNQEVARALEERIDQNLEYISKVDPVAKEIADEYYAAPRGPERANTLLGNFLQQNGGTLASPWGLATAVSGLANMVQRAADAEGQQPTPGATVETSALMGKASKRGQELNKPQEKGEKLDEEDTLLEGIYEVGAIEEGLADLFRPST